MRRLMFNVVAWAIVVGPSFFVDCEEVVKNFFLYGALVLIAHAATSDFDASISKIETRTAGHKPELQAPTRA